MSMSALSRALSLFSGNQIMDRTELAGKYDIRLNWNNEAGPSIFTAVQEQLGLRLVAQKVPMEMIVIDYAEKPVGN
jgi:uncharacterized protein (TIGR03435 family)